jgi:hypothetical protein
MDIGMMWSTLALAGFGHSNVRSMAVESKGSLSQLKGAYSDSAASPAHIQHICDLERQVALDLSHSLPPRPFDFFGVATNFGITHARSISTAGAAHPIRFQSSAVQFQTVAEAIRSAPR